MKIGDILLGKAPHFDIEEENLLLKTILSSGGRIKVLKVFLRYIELPTSLIAELTNLDSSTVQYYVDHLIKAQVLQEKAFGGVRTFRLRIEDNRAQSLKNLFDFGENVQLAKKIF